MALIMTVASTVEPVSLEDVKIHLRLSTAAGTEDSLINTYIQVARRQAENYMKRQIMDATYQLLLDTFPDNNRGAIELLRPPLSTTPAEIIITYTDSSYASQTIPTTFYTIDRSPALPRIFPSFNSSNENSWGDLTLASIPNAVIVQFVSGYASVISTVVPAEIIQWIKMRVGMFYEYREPVTVDQYRQVPRTYMDGLLDGYTILTAI